MKLEAIIVEACDELCRWRANNPGLEVDPAGAIFDIVEGYVPSCSLDFIDLIEDDPDQLYMVPDNIDEMTDYPCAADILQRVVEETLENALWDEWKRIIYDERMELLANRMQR